MYADHSNEMSPVETKLNDCLSSSLSKVYKWLRLSAYKLTLSKTYCVPISSGKKLCSHSLSPVSRCLQLIRLMCSIDEKQNWE